MANPFTRTTAVSFDRNSNNSWSGIWGPSDWPSALGTSGDGYLGFYNNAQTTLVFRAASASTWGADWHVRLAAGDSAAWLIDTTFAHTDGTRRVSNRELVWTGTTAIPAGSNAAVRVLFLSDADLATINADTSANHAESATALLTPTITRIALTRTTGVVSDLNNTSFPVESGKGDLFEGPAAGTYPATMFTSDTVPGSPTRARLVANRSATAGSRGIYLLGSSLDNTAGGWAAYLGKPDGTQYGMRMTPPADRYSNVSAWGADVMRFLDRTLTKDPPNALTLVVIDRAYLTPAASDLFSTVAEAPAVTIAPVPAGDEGTTVALTATVTGGRYDALEYVWAVNGGTLNDATLVSPTWTRPRVNADTDHTIDLVITARGTGTNADANTSDTVSAAQVSARVQDTVGGGPVEEPVANPTVTDTGWIEREETHASQEVIPLRPGIPYYIQVRSVDARYSEWGELHEVTMLPDAPAHLDWFKRTETSVQLAWADIPQATAYDLRKRIKNVAEWDAVVAETQLVHTFEGLTAGETYEFQIRARHEALATEWSPSLEVVMSDQIERVTDLRVARSQDIAIARWDEFIVSEAVPAEGDNEAVDAVSAFEYDIEGYRDDINGSKIFAVTLEATEYRFRTKPDQTYFLRVRAKTGEDDSTTDPTEPDTYTGWTQYTFET